MVFPGQTMTATGSAGVQGLLTREVPAANPGSTTGPVTYKFTASQPGTYMYYGGTRPDLQVEMGLVGTIIVRPTGFSATATTCTAISCKKAYNDLSTAYDREYLFVLSDADPLIHQQVAFVSGTLAQIQAKIAAIDTTKRHPTDWFENGRNFPDTLTYPNPSPDGLQTGYPTNRTLYPVARQFPTQPYVEQQSHRFCSRPGYGCVGLHHDLRSRRDRGCDLGAVDRREAGLGRVWTHGPDTHRTDGDSLHRSDGTDV
jgi:hypothetical protein